MLNIENLEGLVKLARIEIKDSDKERILNLINADVTGVKGIEEINVDNIEPLINPYDMLLEMHNDVVSDGNKQKELMDCAPKFMYNYYIVPKVVE